MENIEKPKDGITWLVIQDLLSRAKRGVEKYNTTLEQNNHDDFLNHMYEELLDAAQYVKKEMTVRKTLQLLIEENPNDTALGAQIRLIYGKSKS